MTRDKVYNINESEGVVSVHTGGLTDGSGIYTGEMWEMETDDGCLWWVE